MRVAVVHDWLAKLSSISGAERVLEQILACYPGADVFTTIDFLPPEHRHILQGSTVRTSFLQRLPFVERRYWDYLPLMPMAVEQFDLSGYDLVISNSHTVAKGVVTGPDQVHVCYLMSPMRFAWDLQAQYLRDFRMTRGLKSGAARVLMHYLRLWDHAASARVDRFLAVSRFIARRAEVCYRRGAGVVYPPVDVHRFTPPAGERREEFYLVASRLVPFKRVDLIVEAFTGMRDRRLVVVGDGPESARVRVRAGPNVTFAGYQDDDALRELLRRARAFLFAAPEDFGIVMVEAQACGTPVIALGRGGAAEIVRDVAGARPTGVLFREQTVAEIRRAVGRFEGLVDTISPEDCRENALRFSPELFRETLRGEVDRAMSAARGGGAAGRCGS